MFAEALAICVAAAALGQRLLERGVLHHVQGEHGFRDGHSFYRFPSDERASRLH